MLKKLFNVKYIFDMRGFWADERIDGGLWPKGGRIYRVAKWFEKRFLLSADSVVSLTNAAVDEMKKFDYLQGRLPNFKVITTCTDLNLFDFKKTNINNSSKESFVLGYVGSVGVWYLFDETLNCFKLILEKVPSAQLHIINRGGHQYIRERLIDKRINPNKVMIETSDHAGVAKAMQSMDVGIFFIKPVYSKMSSAPTKLGEFLGCGIPCLSNTKVGDMAVILNDEKVGVALDSFDETSMKLGIEELMTLLNDPEIRERCRSTALKYFSLDIGVRSYNHIYNRLIS
jgi:glycosyltransferase involved in cell wall biosynthesis